MSLKQLIIYRPFLLSEVKQDVDTMLYNATDILKAYNNNNNKKKDLDDYIKLKSTVEYIDLLNTQKTGELEIITTKRWKFGGTWMCDHLIVDFMMRLSTEFKHMAITFILDWLALAGKRNQLKDWYKKMAKAIADSEHTNFREEATLINVLCTGSPAKNQRARLWIDAMRQMDELQLMNALLIKVWLNIEERKNILIKSL